MEEAADQKIQEVNEQDEKQRDPHHTLFGKGGGYQLLDWDLFDSERHKNRFGFKKPKLGSRRRADGFQMGS
jgi:methylase of polypeptide subunit release factors